METFDDYMKRLRAEVDGFEIWWRENMKDCPNEYPNKMGRGDWDEQFMMYGGE
jgi:hypothetical protein